MKKLFFGIIVALLPGAVMAQWSGTQTNSNVAIGTYLWPSIKLHVLGDVKFLNNGSRNILLESDDQDSWVTFHDPGQNWWSMGLDRSDGIKFKINNGGVLVDQAPFVITTNGLVGIRTNDPDAALTVRGTIHTNEVKVDSDPRVVPDYVFMPGYILPPLATVEAFVKENCHLPEVPSAEDIGRDGLNLKEMNLTLLKKVEELTLYAIESKKENENLASKVTQLEEIINQIQKKINK